MIVCATGLLKGRTLSPCDLGPLSVTLADQVVRQQKEAQKQRFCVTDPLPYYTHNVPSGGTQQTSVVTKLRYRTY